MSLKIIVWRCARFKKITMKLSMSLLTFGMCLLISCESAKNNDRESEKSHLIVEQLRQFFPLSQGRDRNSVQNCFANVCASFSFPRISNEEEIYDMVLLYQIYFSSDFREQKYINQLTPHFLRNYLSQYRNVCKMNDGFESCVFLYIAERNKVECIFSRYDEGKKNTLKMDCKKWAEKKKQLLGRSSDL